MKAVEALDKIKPSEQSTVDPAELETRCREALEDVYKRQERYCAGKIDLNGCFLSGVARSPESAGYGVVVVPVVCHGE